MDGWMTSLLLMMIEKKIHLILAYLKKKNLSECSLFGFLRCSLHFLTPLFAPNSLLSLLFFLYLPSHPLLLTFPISHFLPFQHLLSNKIIFPNGLPHVEPSSLLPFPVTASSSPFFFNAPPPTSPTCRTIRRSTWNTYTAGLTACAPMMKAPTSSSPPLPSI